MPNRQTAAYAQDGFCYAIVVDAHYYSSPFKGVARRASISKASEVDEMNPMSNSGVNDCMDSMRVVYLAEVKPGNLNF